jgi:putative phosphoesterase
MPTAPAIIEMKHAFRIGVISDTHGRFDEAVVSIFEGVDLIVHAGDVGKAGVIQRLEEIAPVLAVEGNNDTPGVYPTELLERVAGRSILIRHIFGELHQIGKKEREAVERLAPDLVIFGHSHRPYQAMLGKTILFNPGSAGPRRFSLPRSVGLVLIRASSIESQIRHLE